MSAVLRKGVLRVASLCPIDSGQASRLRETVLSGLLIGMLLVVAPGAVAYWKGRRLVASLDAPALAERTQAALPQVLAVAIAVPILLPMVLPDRAVSLLVALSIVGGFVGWYPARRVIFRETWSLAGYLSHSLRFLLGYFGYWIAVASAPAFLDGRWAPAAAYGAFLVAWNIGYGWLLAKLMYARPLDRAELEERFAVISARSTVLAPRVFACGPEQGTWPMAFALPEVRGRSTVLIARTLLERLEPEETGAIYAHEVAHLEEHRGARLARGIAFSYGVTLAAVAAPVLLRLWEVESGWASGGVSAALFFTIFAWMASRKGDETKSDLRAAELCGDRGAMASALVKLHQLGQVPRRMEEGAEALSTHPSLARRLQALRGDAPRALAEPVVLASSPPGSFVVLEAERVRWLEGVPDGTASTPAALQEAARLVRSYALSELSELRIASRRGRIELHARRGNEVLRLALSPEEARRAEEALNALDGKLARSEGAGARALARLAASFTFLATVVAGNPLAVLLPAFAALFKPGPLAQTSLGVVGAGVGLLGLAGQSESGIGIGAGATLIVLGLLCAGLGIRAARQHESPAPLERLAVAALVPAAAFAIGAVAVEILPPRTLLTAHLTANDWLTGALHLLGLAVGLWAVRRSALFWLPAAAVAGALLFAGLPATSGLWVQDPFFGPRAAGPTSAIGLKLAGSATLECPAYELRLSPDGSLFATGPCPTEEEEHEYLVGSFDGWTHSVKAVSVALPAEGRALVLEDGEAERRVRLLAVEPSGTRELWSVEVPASLSTLSAATPGWRGDGVDWAKQQLLSVGGELDGPGLHTRRFAFATEGEERLVPMAFVGLEEGFVASSAGFESAKVADMLSAAMGQGTLAVSLLAADAPPAVVGTALTLSCAAGRPGDAEALCLSSSDERTWLWRVPLKPGAQVLEQTWRGDFSQIAHGPGEAVAAWNHGRLLLARVGGGTYEVSYEESCGTNLLAAAVGRRHVALVVDRDDRVELQRFELPPDLVEEEPPSQREAGGGQAAISPE